MRTLFASAALPAVALLLVAGGASAQLPTTPRALGVGSSYLSLARGHEALFLNPANLGLSGTPYWSVAFPQASFGSTILGPRFGDLADMINYDDITQERRDELLGLVPDAGLELDVDLRSPIFAMQVRNFAVGVSYGTTVQQTFGRDIFDLVINGYEDGRTDYRVGNTSGHRVTYIDVAAGYGRRVGPVSVGVTGHYIHGQNLAQSRLFEPRYNLQDRALELDYIEVLSPSGRGFGLDVGAAMEPVKNLAVSASVANAFARMTWSDDLRYKSITVTDSDFQEDPDATRGLLVRFDRSEQDLDMDAAPLRVRETVHGLFDEAYFPTVLRTGATYRLPTRTDVAVGYQTALTSGRLAGWWDTQASVGIQQKLPLISLRAGYTTNLEEGTMLSGGVSLGPVQLGVARIEDVGPMGDSRSGWVGTFGLSARTSTAMPVGEAKP